MESSPNFKDANLEGADLSGTKLPDASFEKANLTGANFSHACLLEANFKQATVEKVNFELARLNRADFRGAKNLDIEKLEKETSDTYGTKFDID